MISDQTDVLPTKHSYPTVDARLPFRDYIEQCRAMVQAARTDLKQRPPLTAHDIVEANSPFELYPKPSQSKRIKQGVLLTHGLFDSPFSMREIASHLQEHGMLSRAILLPGHGTRASDLLHVSLQDWIKAVRYGIETLANEVEDIFLLGYSTGAALSVLEAIYDPRIKGIILLAPAIQIKRPVDMLASWRRLMKAMSSKNRWMYREDEIDYVKYRSVGFQPVAQVAELSNLIRRLQKKYPMGARTFMSISDDDETVSASAAIHFFHQMQNPENTLLRYTHKTKNTDARVILRKAYYPERHIQSFSHVALPFSETNPHYGKNGSFVYASREKTHEYIYGGYNRLEARAVDVLYEFGLVKRKRRELTYNPDFAFMMKEIVNFILK